MEPLRWTWEVRFGPYARATVAARPWLLAVFPLGGAGLFLLAPREWSLGARVLAGAVLAVLALALWLSSLARQLRRRRRTARGQVQGYELTADSLTLSVGRDSYTLPVAELAVLRGGVDWLALRRTGAGRQPLLLFFDDADLVARAAAAVGRYGVRPHD